MMDVVVDGHVMSSDEAAVLAKSSTMMDEVAKVVDGFGGDCHTCGPQADDYAAQFCGLARQDGNGKTPLTRLVAGVAFTGDLDPDPHSAAAILARKGYWVTLMPEQYRPQLEGHPQDDFLEAMKIVSGDVSAHADAMQDEIEAIVFGLEGWCFDCWPVAEDYLAEFCGLAQDRTRRLSFFGPGTSGKHSEAWKWKDAAK